MIRRLTQFLRFACILLSLMWIATACAIVAAQQNLQMQENRLLHLEGNQETHNYQITTNTARLSELERRVEAIDAKKYEDRVARLEETTELIKSLLVAIALGIGTLLIEAAVRITRARGVAKIQG